MHKKKIGLGSLNGFYIYIYILARLLCLISKIIFFQTDYTGQGVDQLQKVIDTIKKNPEDRRIIMCAWNPKGDA